jgi:AcrR family transcriptional regulator
MESGLDTPHARTPKQRRSRQSYDRMIAAATEILREKGLEGLTLAELNRRSGVSIGSIYNRLAGKEDLIRDVQARVLREMEHEFAILVNRVRRRTLPLKELVPALVRELARYLQRHASLLNAFMQQGSRDAHVAAVGQHAYHQNMLDFKLILLERQAEFGHPDPEHAAAACFTIVFGALARYLGLGTGQGEHTGAGEGDREELVEDLGRMTVAFLTVNLSDRIRSSPGARRRRGGRMLASA